MTKTRVVVEHGIKTQIAKVFGCSPQYVGRCLRGDEDGDSAKKIRLTAKKEFGGVEITQKKS